MFVQDENDCTPIDIKPNVMVIFSILMQDVNALLLIVTTLDSIEIQPKPVQALND